MITALDEDYLNKDKYEQVREMILDCLKVLNGYISYLKRQDINQVEEPASVYHALEPMPALT